MKLLRGFTATVFALTLSNTALADNEPRYTLGLHIGSGNMEYKGKEGEGYGSSYLYLNYQNSPFYSLEFGLLGGGDGDWDCAEVAGEFDCYVDDDEQTPFELKADELDLGAFVFAIKSDVSLSKRNKIYGKVGITYYDYEIELHSQTLANESGVGYMIEAGWEYRWDNNVGMNIGLQYQDMDDLEANTINLGISYAF